MSDVEPDFDLDEDLFDFDEILARADEESEKVDLEELLKVLESSPDPSPAPESDDDLIGAEPPAHVDPEPESATEVPAPPTAPAPRPAARAPVTSSRVALVGFAILTGLAVLNLLSVGLSWERGRDVSEALNEMERRLHEATGELRQELFHQAEAMERRTLPIVAPVADSSGLELAAALVEEGEYAEARRRLFALLAVADRYEPEAREEIEGQAAYLLGDAWLAQARAEEERR